jgi:cytochrome c peroxidase
MSKVSVGSSWFSSRLSRLAGFLFLPAALLAVVSLVAFRQPGTVLISGAPINNPLVLPPGWSAPPTPANNPITAEKFVLGRQLFYEKELSGDNNTSCASCHQPQNSFAALGSHKGAFGNTTTPMRNVPRLVNVGYDTVLTWDGHIQTLEQQVHLAVVKQSDLDADTNIAFANLAKNPAYTALFNQAFGSPEITLDRIAMAIATFERCLISGNSPYDQYLNGSYSAMSPSAMHGMQLFFDTAKTDCSGCHNNLGNNANSVGNLFTDNNYYRTGTFEQGTQAGGGYGGGGGGKDTVFDSLLVHGDVGHAFVTHSSHDIGKFRTPTLRNVALTAPYGADGTVKSLAQVIANYNNGGTGFVLDSITGRDTMIDNQDPRIKPRHLTDQDQADLLAFLQSLTDTSFMINSLFQNPGSLSGVEDGHIVSADLSVYPNPATGFVTISSPDLKGIAEATLISSSGVTVWRQTMNADGRPFQLDLTGVANGPYRLQLRAGAVSRMSNIVLER